MARTKPKVLLIEDDKRVRASLSRLLGSEDITVEEFEPSSLRRMLGDGELKDGKTMAGLSVYFARRDRD